MKKWKSNKKDKKKNDMKNQHKAKGKVWFGNMRFYSKLPSPGGKEKKAKDKFLSDIKNKFNENFQHEINLSLMMNKYVPVVFAEYRDLSKNKKEIWLNYVVGQESKKIFLDALMESIHNKRKDVEEILKKLKNRIDEKIEILKNQKYENVFSGPLKTQSRLIIGLGSQHVLETSITLHHIFGVPYIPGSALKGVCRMVAFWKLAENNKGIQNNKNNEEELKKELKNFQNKFYGELCKDDEEILRYQLLFGAQNFKGLLLFLDAYPEIEDNKGIFDLDIMNVHYKSYYGDSGGHTPPGDWENPNPIFFLTVKEGISFCFHVLFDEFRWKKLKSHYSDKVTSEVQELVTHNFLEKILKSALTEFGVGSKTRLGYGLFK